MANILKIKNVSITTEIAITEQEHIRGLMFRKAAPPAMSFIYDKPQINSYWMKNTFVPLDIIFCRSNKVIEIFKGIPHNLTSVGHNILSDLVIEMPYGSAKAYAVSSGTEVRLVLDLITTAKRFELKLKNS